MNQIPRTQYHPQSPYYSRARPSGSSSPYPSPAMHNSPSSRTEPPRKRPSVPQAPPHGTPISSSQADMRSKQMLVKKKKLSDKILPESIQDLVPESQAYMDLLAFERKLDSTIMRKRLDIQEALKRPVKVKRKLRVFISNQFFPAKTDSDSKDEASKASWELRVE
uniref:Uncharacterized protein n=1 Tax=Ciona savignyi TaxID=51511 RepID=H2ZB18_CIOSA